MIDWFASDENVADFALRAEDLPDGTVIRRAYKGRIYVVHVGGRPKKGEAPGRYKYEGRRYRTLSEVAFVITGRANLSGNRFFRLTPEYR